MNIESPKDIAALLSVMARLRDPQGGCPWDLEQDAHSLVPHTLEEAYEVADAVARNDMADLQDELGDLLLQVVFYAQMAAEAGHFDFGDVVQSIVDKLIRRHPHVFGDEQQSTAAGVKARWDEIKAQEKARKEKTRSESQSKAQRESQDESSNESRKIEETDSLLDAVPANLPSLMQAFKLQKKAAKVGFDWPSAAPVFDKVVEELDELKDAQTEAKAEEELGDLLFACVNLARHLHIDPESALRHANLKFRRRFHRMELAAPTPDLGPLSPADLETLWQSTKDTD